MKKLVKISTLFALLILATLVIFACSGANSEKYNDVKLVFDNGQAEKTVKVPDGKDFTLEVPSKDGYYFLGWSSVSPEYSYAKLNYACDSNGNSLSQWSGNAYKEVLYALWGQLNYRQVPGGYAVADCGTTDGLKNLTIPDTYNQKSVIAIDAEAFRLNALEEVILPDTIKTIGEKAFSLCMRLRKIDIPNTVNIIGKNAFEGTYRLKTINLPEEISIIDEKVFYYSGIEEIVIPENIETIGDSAFNGSKLKEITIPENIKEIMDAAFGYSSLEKIVIPDTVETLGDYLFTNCSKLKSVVFPKDLTGLSTILWACYNVEEIFLPEKFNDAGFGGLDDLDNLKEINISEKNELFKSINGNAYSKDGAKIFKFTPNSEIFDYVIPDNITEIAPHAFNSINSLKSITINGNISKLNSYSFENCPNLKTVTILDGVKEIEENAFKNCKGLNNIYIRGQSMQSISKDFLTNCNKVTSVLIDDNNENFYMIGDKVFNNMDILIFSPKTFIPLV